MYAIYAKDVDYDVWCSDEKFQVTEFLGIYSTLELAKQQIEHHKDDIKKRRKNAIDWIPKVWRYYIYSCELDQSVIKVEDDATILN